MRRREFVKQSLAVSMAAMIPQSAFGANERVVLGVMGVRGRGRGLAESFAALPQARVKYLCDVDATVIPPLRANVEKAQKQAPEILSDFRRMLDDKEVDAIVIATPDHWHALATILACQAGKDVYVEKPASHNIVEGRKMIEAARHYKRVVQVGTQRRSSSDFAEAVSVLRSGKLGKIRMAKALNSQRRAHIGKQKDAPTPSGVDYDLWLGPAPKRAFNPNRFHYNWHWFWEYGTGDLGNDGVHHADVARWGLGVGAPLRVSSGGAKLFFDDDQETPDTQVVTYQYPDCVLVYEMRLWSPYGEHGMENGNVFYGDQGYMVLGDRGWQIFGPNDKRLEKRDFQGRGDTEHLTNFLDCVKTRKTPNCDIEEGHLSAMLCHLGNISHRTGHGVRFDPAKEEIVGDAAASRLLGRTYRRPYELPKVG